MALLIKREILIQYNRRMDCQPALVLSEILSRPSRLPLLNYIDCCIRIYKFSMCINFYRFTNFRIFMVSGPDNQGLIASLYIWSISVHSITVLQISVKSPRIFGWVVNIISSNHVNRKSKGYKILNFGQNLRGYKSRLSDQVTFIVFYKIHSSVLCGPRSLCATPVSWVQ